MIRKRKPARKLTDKQRANAIQRERYHGADKEAHPKWQDVYKEIYG